MLARRHNEQSLRYRVHPSGPLAAVSCRYAGHPTAGDHQCSSSDPSCKTGPSTHAYVDADCSVRITRNHWPNLGKGRGDLTPYRLRAWIGWALRGRLRRHGGLSILPVSASSILAGIGALAQSELPRSKICSANDGGWSVPGGTPAIGTITVSNDGGWCGQHLGVEYSETIYGGAMNLSRRPQHGQVSMVRHQGYTDVDYKPHPGYIGPGSFSVLVTLYNIDKPYRVTVVK